MKIRLDRASVYTSKGDFGVISVTERNCPVPILKIVAHMRYRFCASLWCSVNSFLSIAEVNKKECGLVKPSQPTDILYG